MNRFLRLQVGHTCIFFILFCTICLPDTIGATDLDIAAESTVITVNPLTTICASDSPINLSAVVTPAPTGGTVQFRIDGLDVGSAVTGSAGYFELAYTPPSPLAAGSHAVTAVFSGNPDFSASTSAPVTLAINGVQLGMIAKGAQNQGPACASLDPNITLVANGTTSQAATGSGTITYLWQQSTDGVIWNSATVTSPETTNTNSQFNPGPLTVTTSFRRVAISTQNSVQCQAVSNQLTYEVNPLPTVSPITPSGSVSICEGATIQVSNATPGGVWSVNNAANVSISLTGLVTGISAAAQSSSNIRYTVTDAYGCSRAVNKTITVVALPILTTQPSVCIGSGYNLSPATGGSWTSNNPAVASVTSAGLATGLSSGTVTFTFTSNTAPRCTNSTSTVIVNSKPAAAINSADISICEGASTSITGNVTASGDWSIQLNDGSTASGSGNSPFSIPVSPSATSIYTIASLTGSSCNAAANDLGGTTVVTVKAKPAAPTITVENHCDGTSTLTAANYSGMLQWSTGETTASIIVNLPREFSVTQTIDDCTSEVGSVVAAPRSKPALPVTSSPIQVCLNSTPNQLTAEGTNLLWYDSETGGTVESTAPTPPTDQAASFNYFVSQTIENCESDRSLIVVNVVENCSVLPVTLVQFYAKNIERVVLLTWQTTSEKNSDRFEIERSENPVSGFIRIGSKNSAHSDNGATYLFEDNYSSVAGNAYYRLKMIDQDETFAYSRIIVVGQNKAAEAYLYPNPASDWLTIKTSYWQEIIKISVHTPEGKLLYESNAAGFRGTIDTSRFPIGVNVVDIIRSNGTHTKYKFIKVR